MVALTIESGEVAVELSLLEKLGAMHGDLHFPRSAVRNVRVTSTPWNELRGMRAPGTGVAGVIMLGTMRSLVGKDFCAVYRRRPAIVIELEDQPYQRLILSTPQPDRERVALA